MGLSSTEVALNHAAETLRTFPAELDETFWRNAAQAAIITFCEHMDARYCGDMYLEKSFAHIAALVQAA